MPKAKKKKVKKRVSKKTTKRPIRKASVSKTSSPNTSSQIKGVMYWTPRVLAILFALFITLFALDVFYETFTFWQTIVSLLIHLIPTAILLLILFIAWKWEYVGGILYILLGIGFTLFFETYKNIVTFSIISLPVIAIGLLFIIYKYTRR